MQLTSPTQIFKPKAKSSHPSISKRATLPRCQSPTQTTTAQVVPASPLLKKTEDGWQVIAVQSSAPGPQDRWRADNRAIAVTGFRDKLEALAGE